MRIVDLSHELTTGMQVYPGDPAVTITPALTLAADGVAVLSVHLGSQSGTHVDAPVHIVPGAAALVDLDLSHFIGPCRMVDATGLDDRAPIPDEAFDVVRTGDRMVVVRTGWSVHFGTDRYLAHPAPTLRSLERLLRLGVHTIALDVLSLDLTPAPGESGTFVNHELWCGQNRVIAENLRGLDQIDTPGAWLSILPLHLGASDGAPVRAVAYWPEP